MIAFNQWAWYWANRLFGVCDCGRFGHPYCKIAWANEREWTRGYLE